MDWLFYKACGSKDAAMLVKPTNICGAAVTWVKKEFVSRGRFDTTNPQVGDQVIFKEYNKTLAQWVPAHTGLVIAVADGKITTIEGNSGKSVKQKSYKLTDSYVDGFCHPYYETEPEPSGLKPGDIGRVVQGAHVYNSQGKDLGYTFNSWVYNADVIVGEIQNGVAHFSTDMSLKTYTGWTAVENIIVNQPTPDDNGGDDDEDKKVQEAAAALLAQVEERRTQIAEADKVIATACTEIEALINQITDLYKR